MRDTLVKIERLSGGYDKESIIKDISFNIEKGDFLGIIGPNGSGKSTLLRLLIRVLSPQAGEVLFEGRSIERIRLKELFRKVAVVPQDTLINFEFSAREIVLMGRIPHLARLSFETKRDMAIADEALAYTDVIHLAGKNINELSAGERQRVLIAKALAQEPALLYLDEPTSHLDIGHQIQIMELLRQLNEKNGVTIVIVLHDLNIASEYAKRLILLDEGRIFKEGTPADVLTYENIERVYKTVVVVRQNPISEKPYIFLVSKRKWQKE